VSPDLDLALRLADAADAISLPRYRTELTIETKPDLTPVTEADRAVEAEIRRMLAAERPNDAILGEEEGAVGSGSRRWIVDPIDGTRNYARGIPVWATLIALEVDGTVRMGVVSAPALRGRWWAERGGGAFTNGEPMHVSAVGEVEEAVLSFAIETTVPPLARDAWHARGLGDFWAHMLVADGSIDIAVEVGGLAVWDIAAVKVVVEQAGGRCTDLRGDARIDTGDVISTNGLLHDDVVTAFART